MGTRVSSSLITAIQREFVLGVAIVGCIALQLFYVQSFLFGILLYSAYIVLMGSWWKGILTQRFGMSKNVLILWCLGIYAGWLYTTLIGGIASTWYGITPMLTVVCLTVSMLTTVYLRYIAKKRIVPVQNIVVVTYKPSLFRVFPASWMMIGVYAIGWIMAMIFLWQSQSVEALQSPWQTISSQYLWVYFGISVILGCILLSRHRVGTILAVIIVHSLLLHAYLPLSHPLPWGGDVWRNIAVEDTMRQGDLLPPVLVGSQAKWKEVAAIDLPEALVIPHKYAYGQLWSSVTMIGQITTLSSLTIHRWLIPFMWSIFVPIFFFLIGKQMYRSYRMGLLAAGITLIPFTFQALGSLTIAVSTGYVTFFFIMMLWLIALPHRELAQKKIIWIFLCLGIWSYSLHTLIVAVLLGTVACYQYMHSRYGILYPRRMSMVRIGCLLVAISIIPIVEYLLRTIHIPASIAVIDTVKQIIGQFTGWYYATAIRPHDILSGNIWFNHTPLNAYVSTVFTTMRWHIPFMMVVIYSLMVVGWKQLSSYRYDKTTSFMLTICIGMIIGTYLIGWFLLEGDRVFIRRLDGMMATVMIFCMLFGIRALRPYVMPYLTNIYKKVGVASIMVLLVSWFATTTYASGPDIRVVSQQEYDVATILYEEQSGAPACILTDTWVLLVVEAISQGDIVGGGFPINAQFAQPERYVLLGELITNPRASILNIAKQKTNASYCQAAIPVHTVTQEQKNGIDAVFGSTARVVKDWYVWKEALK